MISARKAILVGLLAMLPVAIYGSLRSDVFALFAIANVLIITAALFVAFGPIETSRDVVDSETT